MLSTKRLRRKGSPPPGYGKDLSMYSVEDYTEVKHVMINIG